MRLTTENVYLIRCVFLPSILRVLNVLKTGLNVKLT